MSKKFLRLFSLVLFSCGSVTPVFAYSPSIEASEGNRVAGIDVTIENLPSNATFDKKAVLAKLKSKLREWISKFSF